VLLTLVYFPQPCKLLHKITIFVFVLWSCKTWRMRKEQNSQYIKPSTNHNLRTIQTCKVRTSLYWSTSVQPLLHGKNSNYNMFWACVCSLMYTARNALVLCFHLWLVRLYNIFQYYLTNKTISEKRYWIWMCVFDLIHNFCLRKFSYEEMSEIW